MLEAINSLNLNLFGFVDWVQDGILKVVWNIFIWGPLGLVSVFDQVLIFLSSGIVFDLLFNSNSQFSWENIPTAFWQFAIVAVGLLVIIFISQFLTLQFKEADQMKPKLMSCLRFTGLAGVFVFFIPLGFFFVNAIIVWFVSILNTIFGTTGVKIADALYWAGNIHGGSGSVNDYMAPENIRDWSIIVEMFAVWFVLIAVAMLGLALTQKVFELLFLFLISPLVMAGMVQDEGKRALTWKDMVISKMLAASATLVAYYIYMVYTSIVSKPSFGPSNFDRWAQMLLRLLCLLGGALGTWGITVIIATFIGEGAGAMEGMNSIRTTMAAGFFAAGSAKMVGRALGFAKSKKQLKYERKMGMGGANPLSSPFDESLNSMLGPDATGASRSGIPPISAPTRMAGRSGIIGGLATIGGLAAIGAGKSIWAIKNGWTSAKDTSGIVPTKNGIDVKRKGKAGTYARKFGKAIGAGLASPFVGIGRTFKKGARIGWNSAGEVFGGEARKGYKRAEEIPQEIKDAKIKKIKARDNKKLEKSKKNN
ncbi:Mbov_0396 family ICE element transmembrane protein [Spiroplasma chrysopicola]|uniref:Transmembrane protein n=1 Tax=Spiroplasma chrysopicola DF-1 TaxID=1276227 RepID=R4UC46_9MOLU|nr:hypothetical protein [Spiroplasma chrysopicola]AGM25479.1 hypothetical protein SCHRY_v1c09060 [Spiroplasma chrysopicola DF-1]